MDLPVQSLLFCVCVVISVDSVAIPPVKSPVVAADTDAFVALPCNFTTTDYPQITWYRHRDGQRSLVVQRNMKGRHRVSKEYRDRVGFGNKANLIFIKPETDDSGHYSCEVEVDYENPIWAKVEMDLNVFPVEKLSTNSSTTSRKYPIRVLLFLDWFVPVVCTFVLSRGLGRAGKNTWNKVPRPRRRMTIIVVFLFCLGIVMTFASILLLVECFSSDESKTQHDHFTAGLSIGVTSNITLIIIAVLQRWRKRRCARKWIKKRKSGSEEKDGVEDDDDQEHGFDQCNEAIQLQRCASENKRNEVLPSPSPYQAKGKENQKLSILQKPSEEYVIGMVSISQKDVYFCSKSKIFYKNIEKPDSNYTIVCGSNKSDFVMIAKNKIGVIATIPTRKNFLFTQKPSLVFIEQCRKMSSLKLGFHLLCPSVCIDNNSQHMYITDTEGGRVVRTDTEGNIIGEIGNGMLQKPVCVVQNPTGLLIVADKEESDLFVFQKTGGFVTKTSAPRSRDSEMKGYDKIAMDEDGRLFASDPHSNIVDVFSPDFSFDQIIPTGTESSRMISSIMVVNDSLFVANEDCIRIYPL